jgi:hypothetical protein
MRVKILKLARPIVRMFDYGILKYILEGDLGGRRPTGKLKNRYKLQKDGTELLNIKNWHAAARCRSNCGRKMGGKGHEMG